ncbi:hypothetical protein ESB00_07035 [Oleiharenicola lentus]|jgi:hypothetical protein|uniref:Uncharacterized protein n=1 Tax=Oleiharenicola lentus TaxID=2508720 RepID=A0A4Q1C9G6_9BACT|nr:hypothetical protein [Oleiharenicola lentus]RXK55635.1 hypothetical protein ESB00_07035 [Oleiharenicola lentus]
MSHDAFTRLRYSLIGGAFGLMLSLLLISVLSSQPLIGLKKVLTGIFCAAMAGFFFANASCGVQHKRMWARGSPVTVENSGRGFYWFHLPMNFVFGIALSTFAILAWTGFIKIGF